MLKMIPSRRGFCRLELLELFGGLGLLRDPASATENFGKAPGTARLIFIPLTPHISHTIFHGH